LIQESAERPSRGRALLGGREDAVAGRYHLGSPLSLVPIGHEVAQLLVHGDADDLVPVDHAVRYARAAKAAGDNVTSARFPMMGHHDALAPGHEAWPAMLTHLRKHLQA